MTYVDKLRKQRAIASAGEPGEAQKIGGENAAGARKNAPSAPTPAPAKSSGGKPAPKQARGLSGAVMRQTISDLFRAGEALGLSGPLIAKHARALDQEIASMQQLARVPEAKKQLLGELVPAIVSAASEGLAALDPRAGATAFHQIFEAAADAVKNGAKLDPERLRAVTEFAAAISKLRSADLGGVLRGAIARVFEAERGRTAELGARAFAQSVDALLQSAGSSEVRAAIVRAGVDVAFGAPRGDAQLTDGQVKLLANLGGAARALEAKTEQAEKQAKVELDRQKRLYDANEAGPLKASFAKLRDSRDRAFGTLGVAEQVLWLQRMNANAKQKPQVLEALGRIWASALARGGAYDAKAQLAIDRAVIAFAGAPGVTPEGIAEVARAYVPYESAANLPGVLTVLSQIAREWPNGKNAFAWSELASAVSGKQTAFAAANGARTLLVKALAAAKDDQTLLAFAKYGPRFAHAVKSAEAGAARDLLEASFPADLAALVAAKVDVAALAGAYPSIPEDSVLRLATIGTAHKKELDGWFAEVSELYKNARSNKEHQRSLRSLLALSEKGGADPTKLAAAFLEAKPRPQQVMRAVNALLHQNNLDVKKEHIDRAIAMLGRGEDVAEAIEAELRAGMIAKLNLNKILKDAKVAVTDVGFKSVSGPLSQFFTLAANSPNVDKKLLEQILIAVLEDRFAAFRFTTPATEKQLAVLDADQRRAWEKSQTMTHVRFAADGQKEFDARVKSGAKLGGALFERMTRAWGDLEALERKHGELVAKLREVPKGQVAERQKLIAELDGAPAKIGALRWAKELAEMTPATTTPLRFAGMADLLPSLGRSLGTGMRAAIEELIWTIRIDDLAYSEVVTHDGADLATMFKLATTNCLSGWPNEVSALAYCIDPNKRMIVTKNQAGEARRAMMRLVERQDKGYEGEPMLVLERTYPDRVSEEEKQRLVEHMLRRAAEMGIAAGYPTEYYWDASKTGRGRSAGVVDMNRVIEDLNRRYGTESEQLTIKVTSRAGNVAQEYIDSAPLAGARDAGNVQARRYKGNQDNTYENIFVVLSPKG